MNTEKPNLNFRAPRRILSGVAIVLCVILGAAVTIFFGLIPFVVAFLLQLVIRRPISDAILLPLGATTVLVLWYFLGWLPLVIGQPPPLWPSVVLSTVFAAGFSVSGAFICRFIFARRFTPSPNERNT